LNTDGRFGDAGDVAEASQPTQITQMMNFHRAIHIIRHWARVPEGLHAAKINQGRLLARMNEELTSTDLHDYEFKVFSQAGEDGILQKLVSSINVGKKTFIEFGVEDFTESNCRFLMMKDNWSGFVIDGSIQNIRRIKSSNEHWMHDLTAVHAFITKDNIQTLLSKSGFSEDVGVLSIDVDGVDYWILQAITNYRPRILITEYNAVFGCDRKVSVPYAPDFQRTRRHFSNLYFGASLPALVELAERKGYSFVGTNSFGSNAFFIRGDVMTNALRPLTAKEGFTMSKFRQSRAKNGRMDFLSGRAQLDVIGDMPVVDMETGKTILLREVASKPGRRDARGAEEE
jgi:hypothetical protein